jgi:hypothetical protein
MKILAVGASLSPEKIISTPPNSWSVIQALRHVQMAESASLAYITKKSLGGAQLANSTFYPRVLLVLTDLTFRSGVKIKAPKALENPPISTLEELASDWAQTRDAMRLFIEKFPDEWERKAVYKHPFIGMLSLAGAIQFFNVHQNQHIRQVYRIMRSIR